jgi:adenylate cyclase
MAALFLLRIYDGEKLLHTADASGVVELGRQIRGEPGPFFSKMRGDVFRLVIAALEETTVSRRHVLLELLAFNQLRLANLSDRSPIFLPERKELKPGQTCELDLPSVLGVGPRTVRVEPAEENPDLHSLDEVMLPAGTPDGLSLSSSGSIPALAAMDNEAMLRCLRIAHDLLDSAATSADFLPRAAQAIVTVVGMDTGRVLLLEQDCWKVNAEHFGSAVTTDPNWKPSSEILRRLLRYRRIQWSTPGLPATDVSSLRNVEAVIAAPVVNRDGEVIGALYGDRHKRPGRAAPSITELETQLVKLLARGVASGLARMEQERAVLAERVRFEQFFTKELAQALTSRADLLQARVAEVTIMFCDIRGYSRIAEHLGPVSTVAWLSNVLEGLSDCVLAEKGVVVDYIGDALFAMWGAPLEQADHARLACRAAIRMLELIPELSTRWQNELSEPLLLGIGINTGRACVGNTGSSRKFKYSPQGNAVNLASRVEGITKYLNVPCLITEATRSQLDDSFQTRRLCLAAVANIAEPVELHELALSERPGWQDLKAKSELALREFEGGELRAAVRTLGELLTVYPQDGPALVLLARAVGALVVGGSFERVWKLPGK